MLWKCVSFSFWNLLLDCVSEMTGDESFACNILLKNIQGYNIQLDEIVENIYCFEKYELPVYIDTQRYAIYIYNSYN